MINFLFNLLCITILIIALLTVIVGGAWVLCLEVKELTGIDIVEKVKEWHESKVLTKTGRGQN